MANNEPLETRGDIVRSWNKDTSEGNRNRLFFKVLLDIRDELKQMNKDAPEPKGAGDGLLVEPSWMK